MTAPKPFTPKSLAERWGCSERHIHGLFRKGEIGAFRIGTLWRIPAAEVERIECTLRPDETAKERLPEVYVPRIVRVPGMD